LTALPVLPPAPVLAIPRALLPSAVAALGGRSLPAAGVATRLRAGLSGSPAAALWPIGTLAVRATAVGTMPLRATAAAVRAAADGLASAAR